MKKKPDQSEPLLHANLQAKLVALLTPILAEAVVRSNIMLSAETRRAVRTLDTAMPSHGPMFERLDAIVGPHPLSHFIICCIEDSLRSVKFQEGARKLSEIPSYEDPEAVAVRIVADFNSLPHSYIYSIQLSGIFADAVTTDNRLPFSDRVDIIGGGPLLNGWLPLTTGSEEDDNGIFGVLSGVFGRVTNWDGAFLMLREEGFTSDYTENETDHRVIETIKSFFGLYMAHNLIERRWTPQPSTPKIDVTVHRYGPSGYRLVRRFPLDTATSTLINELHFDEQQGQFSDKRVKRALVTEIGAHVAKAFVSGPDAEKVRLAGRWLFDSYAGGNQLMSFMQAMIVLEIILGDKASSDKVGLGELLRNRCAYLLGKSAQERAEIMAEFGKIYEVRSAIVHRGKSMIRATERPLFFKLRSYAQQVIRAELLLLPDSPHYVSSAATVMKEEERLSHDLSVERGLRAADTVTTRG